MVPSGVIPIATGLRPTGTVVTTLVVVSTTETEFEKAFATYALAPFGVIATSTGMNPTETVAATVFVAVAMTETEFAPELVT